MFYLLQEGEEGYDPEQTHGLICAIKDQSSGINGIMVVILVQGQQN